MGTPLTHERFLRRHRGTYGERRPDDLLCLLAASAVLMHALEVRAAEEPCVLTPVSTSPSCCLQAPASAQAKACSPGPPPPSTGCTTAATSASQVGGLAGEPVHAAGVASTTASRCARPASQPSRRCFDPCLAAPLPRLYRHRPACGGCQRRSHCQQLGVSGPAHRPAEGVGAVSEGGCNNAAHASAAREECRLHLPYTILFDSARFICTVHSESCGLKR